MPQVEVVGQASNEEMTYARLGETRSPALESQAVRQFAGAQSFYRGGILETAATSIRSMDPIYSFMEQQAYNSIQRNAPNPYKDQRFNPYELFQDEQYMKDHPYLWETFKDGRAFQFEDDRFGWEFYVARKSENYENEKRLGEVNQGFLAGTAGFVAPAVSSIVLGGAAWRMGQQAASSVRAFQGGERMVSLAEMSGVSTRVGKTAGLVTAAGLNMGAVGALNATNPGRDASTEEYIVAGAFALAITGAFVPFFRGSSARLAATAQGAAERNAMVSAGNAGRAVAENPKYAGKTIPEVFAMDEAELDSMIASTTKFDGEYPIQFLRSPKTEAKILALEQRIKADGGTFTRAEHPHQGVINEALYWAGFEDSFAGQPTMVKNAFGVIDAAVNFAMPAGKINAAGNAVRTIGRIFFSEARFTKNTLDDSLNAVNLTPAEDLRFNMGITRVQFLAEADDAITTHFKTSKDPIQYTASDNTVLIAKGVGDRRIVGQMASDYMAQLHEFEVTKARNTISDAPEAVKAIVKATQKHNREWLVTGERAGMFEYGPANLERVKQERPILEAKLKEAESAADPLKQNRDTIKSDQKKAIDKITKEHKATLVENRTIYRDTMDALVNPADRKATTAKYRESVKKGKAEYKARRDKVKSEAVEQAKKQTAAIEKAKADQVKLTRSIAKNEEARIANERFIKNADYYMTRRWLAGEINRNPDTFKRLLIDQFNENHNYEYVGAARIDPKTRLLKDDALFYMDKDLADGIKKAGWTTEGELGPTLQQAYDVALQQSFIKSADNVVRTLTQTDNLHGVASAIVGASPIKSRILELNQTRFRDFIDQDHFSVVDRYEHAMASPASIRLAIKNAEPQLRPFVEATLGDKFDGTPEQLMAAVKRYSSERANEVALKDPKLAETMRTRDQRGIEAMTMKLDEYSGKHSNVNDNMGESVALGTIQRIALRGPFLAHMGGMLISNLTDTAALTMRAMFTKTQQMSIVEMLQSFKKASARDLEMLEVAVNDAGHRTLELGELSHLGPDPRLARNATTDILTKIDRGTEYAATKLGLLSGMTHWNRALRRIAAHGIQQELIDGARRMVKVDDLMKSGMAQESAMRNAGISIEDMRLMSHRGFNAAKSRRLLEKIDKHGLGKDGKPITSSHKGFIDPNGQAWRDSDRDLFDTFAGAINSETRNIIVEPKTLSRPLSSRSFLGKIFNQFQSFSYAHSNQQIPYMAQRPGTEQVAYVLLLMGTGAISDAIHNHLSGRRSFADTANQWIENPSGMLYRVAVDRSNLFGWYGRISSGVDRAAPNFSLGALAGNQVSSAYNAQSHGVVGSLFPLLDYADRAASGAAGMLNPGSDKPKSLHLLRSVMPFQNWIGINAAYRLTNDLGVDNPVGGPFEGGKGVDLFPLSTRAAAEERRGGNAQPTIPLR